MRKAGHNRNGLCGPSLEHHTWQISNYQHTSTEKHRGCYLSTSKRKAQAQLAFAFQTGMIFIAVRSASDLQMRMKKKWMLCLMGAADFKQETFNVAFDNLFSALITDYVRTRTWKIFFASYFIINWILPVMQLLGLTVSSAGAHEMVICPCILDS